MSSRSNQLKDGILNQIAEQIKGLQISQQKAVSKGASDFQVTTKNIHLQCLLDLLDHILLHGLEHVEFGYWPFVKELTHSETVKGIVIHPQVTNDLDKGRVWVFTAFSDGLLESYIRLFVDSQKLAKKFYTKKAFVRDKERLLLLQTLVSGLDCISIVLNQERPYLGYGMSPSQDIVAHEPNLPSPITTQKSEGINTPSFVDEEANHSTASSFSNSSTVTGPLSPKSSSTNGSQDTALDETDISPEEEISQNSCNGITESDNDLQVEAGVYSKKSKHLLMEQGCTAGPEVEVSYDQKLSNFPFSRHFQAEHSVDNDEIVFRPSTKKENKKPSRKKQLSFDNEVDSIESDVWYPDTPEKSNESKEKSCEELHDEGACEEAIELSGSYTTSFRSQDSFRAGSNDSLHSSVLSMDSLDQFCKDFDSSLNVTSELSIHNATLHLCNNEDQPDLLNGDNSKEPRDTIDKLLSADGESKREDLYVQKSSEYEGIILGLPKRLSLREVPVTSCDLSVDQNTILKLSLGVFQKNGEQFHRMLVFMSGHINGQLYPIHVLLTDNAIYFLRKVPSKEGTSFLVESTFPFTTLKKVEVGLNCQTVTVTSKSCKCSLFVADEAVTRDFLSSMTSMIVKSGHGSLLSNIVSTSTIQQETQIKRWLCELDNVQPSSINITCFSLVHWYGLSGPDANIEVLSYKSVKEGFLDYRQQQYLGIGSRWATSYFVLVNGTLYQHMKQGDKANKVVVQLRGSRCGGCRRISDPERQFAFEVVSEDGSPIVVFAAPTEADASDWILKLCQSVAEMFDSQEDMGCTVMSCVPCCLVVTKDKIIAFLSDPSNEDTYQLLSSCAIQSVTRLFVDNDVRNYCILKFEHNEITSTEASWFIWFKTEFELAKFERAVSDAWRELFKIDLQFLVLGEGSTREIARVHATSVEDLYKNK